jgi:hypothetical protein
MNSNVSSESTLINEARHPCVNCQRRKVKCDRLLPCTNCLTHGHQCTQLPSRRKPRNPRRDKVEKANVLDRVRQLEETLDSMRAQFTPVVEELNVKDPDLVTDTVGKQLEIKDDDPGRLVIQDDQSRYVSGSSWANLTERVHTILNSLTDCINID